MTSRADLWRGLRVVYLYTPRGGYGYSFRVPATVVKVGERVTLDVELARGGVVRRSVAMQHIRIPCLGCRHDMAPKTCTNCGMERRP